MRTLVVTASLLLTLSAALAQAPAAWRLATATPANYVSAKDAKIFHGGRFSGGLKSVGSVTAKNYAVLLQEMDVGRFWRRSIRMTAWVRTENVTGWAGLLLRVDPARGKALAFNNMQDRPIRGTTPWTRYAIELPVDEQGEEIVFGVMLMGGGEVWLDDVSFEVLGPVLPGARERRKIRGPADNLDFEK